ncbi:107aa long hypothetical protein [Pyrococcus horikoshii OT3]|uniref:Uncharacterized protein n=1 Tax=Pyrococcus horikoshii (strain ATCC 700860 / DSM 12428 / JCM 9974 / NBRC 100139 / OT-3) TaxID=70601 RepID=O59607_PYRHO|nr:107aa long hypothetical protein [Pyrococcus horikoshii OT3]
MARTLIPNSLAFLSTVCITMEWHLPHMGALFSISLFISSIYPGTSTNTVSSSNFDQSIWGSFAVIGITSNPAHLRILTVAELSLPPEYATAILKSILPRGNSFPSSL